MIIQGAKLEKFRLKLSIIMITVGFLVFSQTSNADNNNQIKQYESGGIYEGQFLEGKQHGKGTYISIDGQKKPGLWENDKSI